MRAAVLLFVSTLLIASGAVLVASSHASVPRTYIIENFCDCC